MKTDTIRRKLEDHLYYNKGYGFTARYLSREFNCSVVYVHHRFKDNERVEGIRVAKSSRGPLGTYFLAKV